jgi:TolA-binding protein
VAQTAGATPIVAGGLLKAVLTGVVGGVVAIAGLRYVTTGFAVDEPAVSDRVVERSEHAQRPVAGVAEASEPRVSDPKSNSAVLPAAPATEPELLRALPGLPSTEPARGFGSTDEQREAAHKPSEAAIPTAAFPATEAPREVAQQAVSGKLAEEVAILQRARAALLSGDAGGALSTLREYNAQPRSPVLATEANLLQIQAFLKQGDRATAKRLARRFVASHPDSHHVASLRELLEEP